MRKVINRELIQGRIYEHDLSVKKVQNTQSENFGQEFINGTLDIATDEACMNIVTVSYTYVTPTTKAGKPNNTYTALLNIINSGKTVVVDGKDAATMVKCDTALGLNDFYVNRNGEETLVSAKRNEGGFVTIVTKLDENEAARSTFEVDMLINNVRRVEADPERNIDADYLIVKGAVFNFRNAIMPVEFTLRNPAGFPYFENLDASPSNMVFTKVWGQVSSQVEKTTKVEESAFGEPAVKEYTKTVKEWVITGTSKPDSVYEIGDEQNGITTDEIKKALADRETYLADVKKRRDEYEASKKTTPTANAGVSAAQGGFNF